jgi:hypothetical protein
MKALLLLLPLAAACGHPSSAAPNPPQAPQPVKPTPELAAAMQKLSFMRGVWRGPATGVTETGKAYAVTQTERMGPMLGGDVVVVEGRGYNDDGTTGFNAFAVVSYDPGTSKYELRSYAMGRSGTFELTPTGDGYVWTIPAGPDAMIRYTAHVTATTWQEIGEYVAGSAPPQKMFEMNLTKVGDTDWPLGMPILPSG